MDFLYPRFQIVARWGRAIHLDPSRRGYHVLEHFRIPLVYMFEIASKGELLDPDEFEIVVYVVRQPVKSPAPALAEILVGLTP